MDRQEREAILQAVAAVIDAGQPVAWEQAERDLDAEGRETLRAMRILAEIRTLAGAGRGSRGHLAAVSERTGATYTAAVTEGPQPASQPDAGNAPQPPPPDQPTPDPAESDRFRSREPSSPEEIRRKLFFGAALVLALASVYSGLFGWRVVQYVLAGLAVLTVLVALITGAAPPRPPRPPGTAS